VTETGHEIAVLVGGPYDGDESGVYKPIPDSIWAFPCPHGDAADCEFDGIHWTRWADKAPCGSQQYLWTTIDDMQRNVYKWADLVRPEGLEMRELAEA